MTAMVPSTEPTLSVTPVVMLLVWMYVSYVLFWCEEGLS